MNEPTDSIQEQELIEALGFQTAFGAFHPADLEVFCRVQGLIQAARADELKRNAHYSQGRKSDPLTLCGIDMSAEQVNARIKELTLPTENTNERDK